MNSGTLRSSEVFIRNRSTGTQQPVRILAAIDALNAANLEQSEHIVMHAAQLAKRLNGELHVASVYPTLSADAHSFRIERYLPALRVKVRERQRCVIRQLLRRLRIAGAVIHVEEGEPGEVIDALVSSLQATTVVGVPPDRMRASSVSSA